VRFHSTLPVAASRHISRRSLASAVADWTKSRLPATTGDELPLPGMRTFQSTPSSVVHLMGTSLSVDIPVPLGPRKRGQSPPLTIPAVQTNAQAAPSTHLAHDRNRMFIQLPKQ